VVARPEPRRVPALPAIAGLRILVVEDNAFNQKVISMKLQRWGHWVEVVGSGGEALAVLANGEFDLLFTDIQMPDMDGYELTGAIRRREDGTNRRLPVVALTAHAMKGVRERCLAAGMDDFLSKPIRDEELLDAIRRVAGDALPFAAEDTIAEATQDTAELAPPQTWALDERAILARVGGNRDTLLGLIDVFRQDCRTLMAELEGAIRDGDGRSVRAAAHTIKGMVSFFEAGAAVEAAVRLEKAGEKGDLAGAGLLFDALVRELDVVTAALGAYAPARGDEWQSPGESPLAADLSSTAGT
jgi:CheY-like chemotaxis protein/HPt (histidine-containing phosphotransfer) domain-containing protein